MPGITSFFLPLAAGAAIVIGFVLPPLFDASQPTELDAHAYRRAQADFTGLMIGRSDQAPEGFRTGEAEGLLSAAVVQELKGQCRGGGTYLVRKSAAPGPPLLIAAPHRRADRLTGTLTLRLFQETGAAAAAWNSVHRRAKSECRGTTDLARLRSHPFTAFAAAFANTHPNGRVVQIHGFDPARRISAAGRRSAVILSSGSEEITPAVSAVTNCLRRAMPNHRTSAFPIDVRELGARKNAQGQALRALDFPGFVHVELAYHLRKELMNDENLRKLFGKCLQAGL
ncbi:hypothetical protein G7A66_13025 [Altererythrobacter sp. SALINAS58]|uniref:hypothetical protein n=1 Tax=Alteripontixanthobacter muriae TaxID=2705546 RepID=UPI0015757DEA|nr:hypothetical protein [Alteripontixanthobacter muriae]NTZ43986.1 hypothetical protein [Alteripontixanthobacter muriae]